MLYFPKEFAMSQPQEDKPLTLNDKYKARGAQSMSMAEYLALKEKNSKKPKLQIPTFVKYILGSPFIILFCAGLLFIPYILYTIATSPSAPEPKDDDETSVVSSTRRQ